MSVLIYPFIKRRIYCLTDCNVIKSSSGGSLDFYNDKSDRGDSAAEEIPKDRYVLSSISSWKGLIFMYVTT